jgi:hypothetical protein
MRSFIRAVLALFALGAASVIGCGKPQTPIGPADVVLTVPGMY